MSPPRWRAGAISDPAILAEAARWYDRLRDAPGDKPAFEAWRDRDDRHAAAYRQVSAAHDTVVALADEPALLALRHQTLARATLARRTRFRVGGRTIAAGMLLCVGAPLAALGIKALVPPSVERPVGETFRTGIGQRADVTLPDGSRVTLDTASGLQVLFSGSQRRVRLEGQAWFDLKPSATPFVIAANGMEMRADSGTFDVRADRGLVRAYAVAGTLNLDGRSAQGGGIAAPAGRLLAVQGGEVSIRKLADPLTFTGWHSGLLQFDNVPVMAAAQELNRYRRRPIRIADGRVADMRISGAFEPTESPAFVDALTSGFPVSVKQDDKAGTVIAAR
ncbi:MAG: FecR family protein [Sphingomonas sp.]